MKIHRSFITSIAYTLQTYRANENSPKVLVTQGCRHVSFSVSSGLSQPVFTMKASESSSERAPMSAAFMYAELSTSSRLPGWPDPPSEDGVFPRRLPCERH